MDHSKCKSKGPTAFDAVLSFYLEGDALLVDAACFSFSSPTVSFKVLVLDFAAGK